MSRLLCLTELLRRAWGLTQLTGNSAWPRDRGKRSAPVVAGDLAPGHHDRARGGARRRGRAAGGGLVLLLASVCGRGGGAGAPPPPRGGGPPPPPPGPVG